MYSWCIGNLFALFLFRQYVKQEIQIMQLDRLADICRRCGGKWHWHKDCPNHGPPNSYAPTARHICSLCGGNHGPNSYAPTARHICSLCGGHGHRDSDCWTSNKPAPWDQVPCSEGRAEVFLGASGEVISIWIPKGGISVRALKVGLCREWEKKLDLPYRVFRNMLSFVLQDETTSRSRPLSDDSVLFVGGLLALAGGDGGEAEAGTTAGVVPSPEEEVGVVPSPEEEYDEPPDSHGPAGHEWVRVDPNSHSIWVGQRDLDQWDMRFLLREILAGDPARAATCALFQTETRSSATDSLAFVVLRNLADMDELKGVVLFVLLKALTVTLESGNPLEWWWEKISSFLPGPEYKEVINAAVGVGGLADQFQLAMSFFKDAVESPAIGLVLSVDCRTGRASCRGRWAVGGGQRGGDGVQLGPFRWWNPERSFSQYERCPILGVVLFRIWFLSECAQERFPGMVTEHVHLLPRPQEEDLFAYWSASFVNSASPLGKLQQLTTHCLYVVVYMFNVASGESDDWRHWGSFYRVVATILARLALSARSETEKKVCSLFVLAETILAESELSANQTGMRISMDRLAVVLREAFRMIFEHHLSRTGAGKFGKSGIADLVFCANDYDAAATICYMSKHSAGGSDSPIDNPYATGEVVDANGQTCDGLMRQFRHRYFCGEDAKNTAVVDRMEDLFRKVGHSVAELAKGNVPAGHWRSFRPTFAAPKVRDANATIADPESKSGAGGKVRKMQKKKHFVAVKKAEKSVKKAERAFQDAQSSLRDAQSSQIAWRKEQHRRSAQMDSTVPLPTDEGAADVGPTGGAAGERLLVERETEDEHGEGISTVVGAAPAASVGGA